MSASITSPTPYHCATTPPSFHFSPSPPLITARGFRGSDIAPPAGLGKARPPNALLCNLEPQICKPVKSFTHVHKRRPYNINSREWRRLVNFVQVTIRCLRYSGDQKLFLFFFARNSGALGLCAPGPCHCYVTEFRLLTDHSTDTLHI